MQLGTPNGTVRSGRKEIETNGKKIYCNWEHQMVQWEVGEKKLRRKERRYIATGNTDWYSGKWEKRNRDKRNADILQLGTPRNKEKWYSKKSRLYARRNDVHIPG